MTQNPDDDPTLDRRDFIRDLTGILAIGQAGFRLPFEERVVAEARAAVPFVGIQMGPHTMLDEGIEHTLDLIRETAAVDVVMPYSHGYNNAFVKPLRSRANHGIPLTDNAGRKFPMVWVKTHDRFYQSTTLRHQVVDTSFEHHSRDLFAEMIKPARARGHQEAPRLPHRDRRQSQSS